MDFPNDPLESPDDPDTFRLRIQGLFDSYHDDDVDFLAENIQNAIDALEELFAGNDVDTTPRLELAIDFDQNKLVVRDNGPGIPSEVLDKISRPVNSGKVRGSKRGYKGVGLAYAAWSTNKFIFATKRDEHEEYIAGELDGGQEWVENGGDPNPVITQSDYDCEFLEEQDTGTVFELHLPEQSSSLKLLKRINDSGVETFLRTKTAIGYVDISDGEIDEYPGWLNNLEISIQLSDREEFEISAGYQYPHSHENVSRRFDLDDSDGLTLEDIEDQTGHNKIIFKDISNSEISNLFLGDDGEVASEDEDLHSLVEEQQVSAYGAFVDEKATLRHYSEDLYLSSPGRGRKRHLRPPGIHIATATMPCGEHQRIELSYGTGNSNRLYFLFDFDDISPDEGRKSYTREVNQVCQRVVDYYAREEFVPNRKFLIQQDRAHGTTEAEQEIRMRQPRDQISG